MPHPAYRTHPAAAPLHARPDGNPGSPSLGLGKSVEMRIHTTSMPAADPFMKPEFYAQSRS